MKYIIAILAVIALAGCSSKSTPKPDLVGTKVYGKDNHPYTGSFVRGLLSCGAAPASKSEEAQLVVSFEELGSPKTGQMVLVVRDASGSVLNSILPPALALEMSDDAIQFAEAYSASIGTPRSDKK